MCLDKVRTLFNLSFDVVHKLPSVLFHFKIWSVLKKKTDRKKSQAKQNKNSSLTFYKHSWFLNFIPIESIAIYINKLLGFALLSYFSKLKDPSS